MGIDWTKEPNLFTYLKNSIIKNKYSLGENILSPLNNRALN